jgi:hypothetical protein
MSLIDPTNIRLGFLTRPGCSNRSGCSTTTENGVLENRS